MHPEASEYVKWAVGQIPAPERVVEFGSYNVNGSVREYFECPIHGLDIRPGRDVDEVADITTWTTEDKYDVVISSETLEHCVDPQAAIRSAYAALKRGGYLIVTAAGPERIPHNCDGVHHVLEDEHYANIDPFDLRKWLHEEGFEITNLEHLPGAGDVRALARKT